MDVRWPEEPDREDRYLWVPPIRYTHVDLSLRITRFCCRVA